MTHVAERADARANRARLIAAAHEVFRERGLDAEMKEIAERAGIGVGTIYRNFPKKDDLIAAIFGEALEEMEDALGAAEQIDDPIESMRCFLRGAFAVVERCGYIMAALMHGNLPEGCRAQIEERHGHDGLEKFVRRGVDAGVLRSDIDIDVLAAQFKSCMTAGLEFNQRQPSRLHQMVDSFLSLFLDGARART